MDDFDVAKEDNEGRVQLDPSVWANPYKTPAPQNPIAANASDPFGYYRNPDAFLRQHFPNPFAAQHPPPTPQQAQLLSHQQHQQLLQQQHQQQQQQLHMQQHQQQMQMLDSIKPMVSRHNILLAIMRAKELIYHCVTIVVFDSGM